MSEENIRLSGSDLIAVLNTSRNPLVLGKIRNEALVHIKESASQLPEGKCQACRDYVSNFNTNKRMSDQLRDLAVWVDEVNAYLDHPGELGAEE